MKRRPLLFISVLAILSFSGPATPVPASALQLHSPIFIDGNAGFSAVNGVTSGRGTAADPYIIEGWDIQTPVFPQSAIEINNTTAYFIVRDVSIHPDRWVSREGIRLSNVVNGRIEKVSISIYGNGVELRQSSRITVSGSTINASLFVRSSNLVTVSENSITYSEFIVAVSDEISIIANSFSSSRLTILGARGVVIEDNRISEDPFAVFGEDAITVLGTDDNLTIRGNTISEFYRGILLGTEEGLNPFDMISNVTISSNNIINGRYGYGIRMRNVVNANITNNRISDQGKGADIDESHDIVVRNNTLSSNGIGLDLHSSDHVIISDNKVSQNWLGIYLDRSTNVTVSANAFLSDGLVVGYDLERLQSYTVTLDNRVNERPLYFYRNCQSGLDLEGIEIGQLIIVNCRGIRISNLRIHDTIVPVQLFGVQDVIVSQSDLSNNDVAITITQAENVTMTNSLFSSKRVSRIPDFRGSVSVSVAFSSNVGIFRSVVGPSVAHGIYFFNSTYLSVIDNRISDNGGIGLAVYGGTNATIKGNVFSSNGLWGVDTRLSNGVMIADNQFYSNKEMGIAVGWLSKNTMIIDNDVTANGRNPPLPGRTVCGISLASFDEGITVSHNNIIDNEVQACDGAGGTRSWDAGYPAGGNYWSDYTGNDNCSGETQDTCPSPDGIGDTPYVIDEDGQDRYPSIRQHARDNSSPVAFFTIFPAGGYQGTLFSFNASLSWDLNDPPDSLEVRWDWDDDGNWDTEWSKGKVASHQYSLSSRYTVRLEVKDSTELPDSTSRQLDVREDTTPPNWHAESALTASNVGTASLTLNWGAAADNVAVTVYKIYEGETLIATAPADTFSYAVIGLSPGTTYTFRVQAGDAADNWSSGDPLLVITTAPPGQTPSPPSESSPWVLNYWYLALGGATTLTSVFVVFRLLANRKPKSKIKFS